MLQKDAFFLLAASSCSDARSNACALSWRRRHRVKPAHCPGGEDIGCSTVTLQLTRRGSSSTSSKTAQETVRSRCRFPRLTRSGLVNHIPWIVSMTSDDCEYSWPWDAHSDADGVSWCSSLPSPDNPPPLTNSRSYHYWIAPIWRQPGPNGNMRFDHVCCFQLLNHSLK